jgi:hypothetical protein
MKYCASCGHPEDAHGEDLLGRFCDGRDQEQPYGAPRCRCQGFIPKESPQTKTS